MAEYNTTEQTIYQTINFIAQKQREMEELRQELNLQIAFNLKDTYLSVAKEQNLVSIKNLAVFLNGGEHSAETLQKCVRWNNHNTSLNLSFSEFSALLINKEDRLLAKMVLERQAMGAIPNFLLEIVRQILNLELAIHDYCNTNLIEREEDLVNWLQNVMNCNGDIDPAQLNGFVFRKVDTESDEESRLFLRYLRGTGNLTVERLRSLWLGESATKKQVCFINDSRDSTIKMNKISTLITCPSYPTSPKSLHTVKSQKQFPVRPEYFDCLNRPVFSQDHDIRKKKSIEKHLNRIESTYTKKILGKLKNKRQEYKTKIKLLLSALVQIVSLEKQTEDLRVQLCMCPDFYPILFFDTMPKEKNGSILASYFKDYLEEFGYHIDLNQVYFLFRRYSKELGRLNFNSFCSIFDVCEAEFNLIQKNRFIETLNDIEITTKKIFFSTLLSAAQNEQKINQIKVNLLKQCPDLTETLDFLFRQNPEGLTEQLLKDLCKQHPQLSLSRRDVKLLWKKMKINLKNEDRIQKYHLLKELTPITIRKNKIVS